MSMDWRNPRTLVSIRMVVLSTQVQRATSSHRLSLPSSSHTHVPLTLLLSPSPAAQSPRPFWFCAPPSGPPLPLPVTHCCLGWLSSLERETENPAKPGVETHYGIQETRGQRAAISKRIPKGKTDRSSDFIEFEGQGDWTTRCWGSGQKGHFQKETPQQAGMSPWDFKSQPWVLIINTDTFSIIYSI